MMRTGIGFDAHALEAGRPLILGGVEIDYDRGLAGHSDGDVVCHAIADALLGAAGLGDLGEHFPNDEQWRGAASTEILIHVATMLREAGWSAVNVDVTVLAEEPKLSGYRERMVDRISECLDHTVGVWVKATTTDGLGFTGRGEGIAALASVLLTQTGR
jgi:2-C-methyl-D-erythritol 2,4-cyclodiphosphate synthase